MKRHRFNQQWMNRHLSDPYVKQAQKDGYRARAAYKLLEIDQRDRLLKPGITVVDLGSAPGAWSQVLSRRVLASGRGGRVLALDLLPMEPIAGVEFLAGDIRDDQTLQLLQEKLPAGTVDLVLSDMAPNLSGVASADAARMSDLAELAVDLALRVLKPDGVLLVKCFHGSGYSQLVELFKRSFRQVVARKPQASRAESAETYLLGRTVRAGGRAAEPGDSGPEHD